MNTTRKQLMRRPPLCQPNGPSGCAAYTPCLTQGADPLIETISEKSACACLSRDADVPTLLDAMDARRVYGATRRVDACLASARQAFNSSTASRSFSELPKPTLRISGPQSDGFWVRALVVLAHAMWARTVRLPISVSYRSAHDTYLDPADRVHDGWTQYFNPIRAEATTLPAGSNEEIEEEGMAAGSEATLTASRAASGARRARPPRLVSLDCGAAARVWEAYANYAFTYRARTLQSHLRAALVRSLPIEARREFKEAAETFWRANVVAPMAVADGGTEQGARGDAVGGDGEAVRAGERHRDRRSLGVHLRGTDKPGSREKSLGAYLPLIRAYLCTWPATTLFVATDDQTMLDRLLAQLRTLPAPPARVVWRNEAMRSNSSLNPGVDARLLSSSSAHDGASGGGGGASLARRLGRDVLLDTLLLAKCDYLLKAQSSVSDFATLFSPHLIENSFDITLPDQPRPSWADNGAGVDACAPRPRVARSMPRAPEPSAQALVPLEGLDDG